MHRCRFVLNVLSGPWIRTLVSKLILTTSVSHFARERSCLVDDLRWSWLVLSRRSPSGLSCCHLMITWSVTSRTWWVCGHCCVVACTVSWAPPFVEWHLTSWHFGGGGWPPPPDWIIFLGSKRMSVAPQMTQISCIYNLNGRGSQWCQSCRITRICVDVLGKIVHFNWPYVHFWICTLKSLWDVNPLWLNK